MLILLAIFGVSGRILMEPIPNVQPVTVLVILTGAYFGAPRALALAAIVTLASNVIFMGHGPWTIFQAIGWGAIGICGALLSDKLVVNEKLRLNRLALMAAASGIAFNWFVSLSILLDTGFSMLVPYLLNGLVFDLYHAFGNILFVAWMATPLGEIMSRHRSSQSLEAVRDGVAN
tara:strand:+ start:670 stop:1194 length:525 start_codon:yes stop_codon:yes gene_type:complete